MKQKPRFPWAACAFPSVGLLLLVMLAALVIQIFLIQQRRSPTSVALPSSLPSGVQPTAPHPDAIVLPMSGTWIAQCTHRHPEQWRIQWTLVLDLSNRTFTSQSDWAWDELAADGWTYLHHINEDGSGSISDDGLLEGRFDSVSSVSWTKESVTGGPQVNTTVSGQYGAIARDLQSICLSRGLDPGVYDADYIRRIGREAFFLPGSACEADCRIDSAP